MIQYRAFVGSIEEIAAEFNKLLAGLPRGVNVNSGPLTRLDDGSFVKEAIYVLPERSDRVVPAQRIIERVN